MFLHISEPHIALLNKTDTTNFNSSKKQLEKLVGIDISIYNEDTIKCFCYINISADFKQ